MKRPLFFLCLCSLFLLTILTATGVLPLRNRQLKKLPTDGSFVLVSGRITDVDAKSVTISKVTICPLLKEDDSFSVSNSETFSFKLSIETSSLDGADSLSIGNTITLTGTFTEYKKATNPGEFDAYDYYQNAGYCGKIRSPRILSNDGKINLFLNQLSKLRSYLLTRLYHVYPEREASILADLILGEKSDIDKEIKELYQQNGIAHILSISSLHVTILGMGLFWLLKKLGLSPQISGIIGCVFLIIYGIMTGMSVSAARAIGMYILTMLALLVGRTADRLTSLSLLAVILAFTNPTYIKSCSFLLSFCSVLGITCIFPAIKKTYVTKEPQSPILKKLLDSFLCSLSITLSTLPIQLFFYYEIPTMSVLLNLIVIPLMTILMVSALLSMLIPGLGVLGTIAYYILKLYEWLCTIVQKLPFSNWNPGRPETWVILVYITFLLALLITPIIYRRYLIPAGFVALFILLSLPKLSTESVIFLDVGQGDATILYTSAGEVFLFDGGSSSKSQVGKYVIKNALKYYGLSHIDGILISHPDSDHCNGAIELLQNRDSWNLKIDKVYLPGCSIPESENLDLILLSCQSANGNSIESANGNSRGSATDTTVTALNKKEVPIDYIAYRDIIYSGSDSILCLHPATDFQSEDMNEISECFIISLKEADRTLLMVGDAEGAGESALTQVLSSIPDLKVDILKVSHHGSKYSTTDDFLSVCNPLVSIISVGANNRYGHPSYETLERLSQNGSSIYRTDLEGALTIRTKGRFQLLTRR